MSEEFRPRPDDHLVEPFFAGLDWSPDEEARVDPTGPEASTERNSRIRALARRVLGWLRWGRGRG